MRAEREAACDELALAALATDRAVYAATIIDLAANLAPSQIVPGMIGLFSSRGKLATRIERIVRTSTVHPLRPAIIWSFLLILGLVGLTDAMPGTKAQSPKEVATQKEEPKAKTHTVSGRCVNDADSSPLAGISVRLYRVEGRTAPPVEIARTVTDADGRYAFTGLVLPRPDNRLDRLVYGVFGFADDRPIGISFFHFRDDKEIVELRMTRQRSTLSGKVIDDAGQAVARAIVLPYFVYDRPFPGLLSATTDAEGRFKLENMGVYKWPGGKAVSTPFVVLHPDHPKTSGGATTLPADVVVTLPTGCVVTGTVTDSITSQPAAGIVIIARRVDEWDESFFATDATGHFRVVVPEGRYDFLAEAKDRVCVALTGRDCLAGAKVELPPLKLIGGGFISGQVINTATGQPVSVSERGAPIMLGLVGPSQPAGRVIAQIRLAEVDQNGRFTLRAAPGKNFPYFVNTRGVRMAWDTQKQPPVVVKDGNTTTYNMRITPPVPPKEKMKAARKLVDALSKKPSERAAQILLEFRKLNHTVDETELWCVLMRELVGIGRDAVPQLCAELDRTNEQFMLRRLGFALRAIGDARAVPALVRSIPKTLQLCLSDYGLLVGDKELTRFMQQHDLDEGGTYFDLKRPVREIFGALHKLTGQNLGEETVYGVSLNEDPHRQVLQKELYRKQAERWQVWWDANWKNFTDDASYARVNLPVEERVEPPPAMALGPNPKVGGNISGATLSPPGETGAHFLDLDTGFEPEWPKHIPQDQASAERGELALWAAQNGVDLMCTTYQPRKGTPTYALRSFNMRVWEISIRDAKNIETWIQTGKLPKLQPAGELLLHQDKDSGQYAPETDAAFIYLTREGGAGVIEITDRITRVVDLTGQMAGYSPRGAGFHKGVKFDHSTITP